MRFVRYELNVFLFDVSIDAARLGPTFTKKSLKALAICVLSWLSLPLTLIVFYTVLVFVRFT